MNTDPMVPLVPFETSVSEIEFKEGLPQTLVSVLQRRYLANFQPSDWRIEPRAGDHARPLLREIVALGRPPVPGFFGQAMPHVLAACHEPGHSLVVILHGARSRHRLYVGGRRIIGAGARCTEDYFALQDGAFRSHLNGLEFSKDNAGSSRLLSLGLEDTPELAAFLRDAPATRFITGIPSRSPQDTGGFQSLDRLVAGIGEQRYVMMLVAEPLESDAIDSALDVCRRLRGELHSYIRRTVSSGRGGSESESHTDSEETAIKGSWKARLPLGLSSLAAFASVVTLPFSVNVFPLTQALGATMHLANMINRPDTTGRASQLQSGTNWSESSQVELLDAHAEACQQLLQRHIDRLMKAQICGWWRTAIYIVAESDAAAHAVAGGLRSLASGDGSGLDPLRVLSLPDYLVRGAIERGQILQMLPLSGDHGHPLGASFDALATCIDSEELSVLSTPPQREIPGLRIRDHGEFALSAPAPTPDSIEIGSLLDEMERDLGPVTISADSLNRHVFVAGTTGSGKTNTCKRILLESYKKGIPFLVLEPAKSEYRLLLQTPELKGKLGVYSIGEGSALPLRLNPLAPVTGMPLGRHIDMLKAVFNASFTMFSGMPQALEEALLEIYTERGWNIYTSRNVYLEGHSSLDNVSALTPTLRDLHDKIDGVLQRKGYASEIRNNMGAALRSRLGSLMVGHKGLALNTRRSTPLSAIFGRPAVVELQNLGDDDEKAFVMALLFVLLCEYAEARQRDLPENQRNRLQHLTLVEEAHRLLEAPRGAGSTETGDPRRKAVSMFTNMLAEMRAYGEGFLIADQIPSKLAPEILKNSNLKIAHQLPDSEDRYAVGNCMNLNEGQIRHLNSLAQGRAVVHDERIGAAVLVHVSEVKSSGLSDRAARELAQLADTGDKAHLYRHAGCCSCSSPCDFLPAVEGVRSEDRERHHITRFLENLLLGDAESAWSAWTARRMEMHAQAKLQFDSDGGIEYCAAAQATHEWLTMLLLDRRGGIAGSVLLPDERLLQESAARLIGPLLAGWLRTPNLNGAAREVFLETHRRLASVVAAAPPHETPGCGQCPLRCRMLRFVAPYLARMDPKAELSKVVAKASQTPAETALKSISQMSAGSMNSAAILTQLAVPGGSQRAWLYCLVVNLKLPAPNREKLLTLLREAPDSAEERELRDIFGGA